MALLHRTGGWVWLDVPFAEKDRVKALGARWDPAARSWYAPRPGMRGFEHWERLPEVLPGEDRTFGGPGLFVDLIPSTSWFTNVRSAVDRRDWERLRQMVYRRAGYRCEACGCHRDKAAGLYMEAHERFSYDVAAGVQKLRRLVCLCTACHGTTHFGLAQISGEEEAAMGHLQFITGMSPRETRAHVEEAFVRWAARSGTGWALDLSVISDAGITLAEGGDRRAHTA
jgi:hypothetical protein